MMSATLPGKSQQKTTPKNTSGKKRKREEDTDTEEPFPKRIRYQKQPQFACDSCRREDDVSAPSSVNLVRVNEDAIEWVVCRCSLASDMEKLLLSEDGANLKIHVVYASEERTFSVHRHILKARSYFFGRMLDSPFSEGTSESIDIRDVRPDVFAEILRFLYTERVDLTPEIVIDFAAAADRFCLGKAMMFVAEYISKIGPLLNNVQIDELLCAAIAHNMKGSVMRNIMRFCGKKSMLRFFKSHVWKSVSRKTACTAMLRFSSLCRRMDDDTIECFDALCEWYTEKARYLVEQGLDEKNASVYAEEIFYFFPPELFAEDGVHGPNVNASIVATYLKRHYANPMRVTYSVNRGKLMRTGSLVMNQTVSGISIRISLDMSKDEIKIQTNRSLDLSGGVIAIYHANTREGLASFEPIPWGTCTIENKYFNIHYDKLINTIRNDVGFDTKIVIHIPLHIQKNTTKES